MYISVNVIVIYVITTIWLCLEMHAVTKMADLTKFRQTERMFMDLAILANFSQILQSEISLSDLTILANVRHFRYCMHFWTYLSLSSLQLSFICISTVSLLSAS